MSAVELKAYGDFRSVTANRDGSRTTRAHKQVIMLPVVVDDRAVLVPCPVIQHEWNMLAAPAWVAIENGVTLRFDRWSLFDMQRERMLPETVATLDPSGPLVASLVMRYVLEARHLADKALAPWMSGALAAAGVYV